MKPSVLVFSTSAGADSKSRTAAEVLVTCLRRRGVATEFADVRDLPPVWVTGAGLDGAGPKWMEVGKKVEQAATIVFTAPVHCFTVGSPTRVVAELVSGKLAGKPVGLITAAGSPRSALAHRDFLYSLCDEVGAQILPKTVQVTGTDFTDTGEMSEEIQQRIAAFADAVVSATCAQIAQIAIKETVA